MKLKNEFFLKPEEGKEKIVEEFLWFPLCFGDEGLSKLFETAMVVYKVVGDDLEGYDWKPVRFATVEDMSNLPTEYHLPCEFVNNKVFYPLAVAVALLFGVFSTNLTIGILYLLASAHTINLYNPKDPS